MQRKSPASFGISASARARGPPVGSGGVWARWALLPPRGFYSSSPSRADVWLGDAERPLRGDLASLR